MPIWLRRPAMNLRPAGSRVIVPIARVCTIRCALDRLSTSWLNASVSRSTAAPTGWRLALVAVQEPVGRGSANLRGQLPAKVHRIADTGVHPLPTQRGMHMRGVPGDEHLAHAVALSLLAFGQEPRAQRISVMP